MPRMLLAIALFASTCPAVAMEPAIQQYAETYSTVVSHVSSALDREYFRIKRNEKEAGELDQKVAELEAENRKMREEYRLPGASISPARVSEILERMTAIRGEIENHRARKKEMAEENQAAEQIIQQCLDAIAAGWYYTVEDATRHSVYQESLREFFFKVTPIEMEGETPTRLLTQSFLAIKPTQETASGVSLTGVFAQEAQLVRPRWPLSLLFNASKEKSPTDREVYAAAREEIAGSTVTAEPVLEGLLHEWARRDWFGRLYAIWAMNQEGFVLEVEDVQNPAATTIRVEAGDRTYAHTFDFSPK